MRVCIEPGCPSLTRGTRCATHERDRDRARGSSAARGYGTDHRALRGDWQKRIDGGELVACWRCGGVIDGPWQLGHCDNDRSRYHGPEHPACNLAVSGRAGARCPHPSHY